MMLRNRILLHASRTMMMRPPAPVNRTTRTSSSFQMRSTATETVVETTAAPSTGSDTSSSSRKEKVDPTQFYMLKPEEGKPAERDAANFELDPSVSRWQDWKDPYYNAPDATSAFNAFRERLQNSGALSSVDGASYWGYHFARILYFLLNGAVGALSSGTSSGRGFVGGDAKEAARRISMYVSESLAMFKQDWDNIQAGKYKAPWDYEMGLRHRQLNPAYMLDKSLRFFRESSQTLARMQEQVPDKIWIESPLFPSYYKTFHFQTEGWLSTWSSRAYEYNTEVLFSGRQDAMQRQALLPLKEFMEGRNQASVRILEIGAGTGRYHTFLRDNYPAAKTTIVDLSPFYLERARDNIDYWVKSRCQGSDVGGTTYLMANAEDMSSLPDASMDVITSTYMFHEMPPQARINVAREVKRLLKKGGMFIFCDSLQYGDRPEFDKSIHLFTKMNEAHYVSFLQTDFGALFKHEAGLTPQKKYFGSRTKVLSFIKE